MENTKMLFIDVTNEDVKVVTPASYHEYHDLIGCRCFDVTRRRVGDEKREYEFICDDEGLLKSNPIISALNGSEVMLVGNLLVAGKVDFEGDFTDITDDDVNYLKKYIKYLVDISIGTVHPVLVEVHY